MTENLSLAQQLCVVQMGWRREETICLIITRRFMLFLISALKVASFCSTAPPAYFRQRKWAEKPPPCHSSCRQDALSSAPAPPGEVVASHECLSNTEVRPSLRLSHLTKGVHLHGVKSPLMLPNAASNRFHRRSEQPKPVHMHTLIPPSREMVKAAGMV